MGETRRGNGAIRHHGRQVVIHNPNRANRPTDRPLHDNNRHPILDCNVLDRPIRLGLGRGRLGNSEANDRCIRQDVAPLSE
jgi:hypothetical protein